MYVSRHINITPFLNYSKFTFTKIQIMKFNPNLHLEEAYTPPSSWYTDKEIYDLEIRNIFKQNWIAIASDSLLTEQGSYISGKLVDQPFVIVKNKELRAFYNVCRHHASTIVKGTGKLNELVCPYHGWTFNLEGNLTKCTQMKGIKDFSIKNNGLNKIGLSNYEKILFLNLNPPIESTLNLITKPLADKLKAFNYDPAFKDMGFVCRKEYTINCNWKVFVDNYCDGGYHVPYGHKDLCSNFDMKSYNIEVYGKCSIQTVLASWSKTERLGDAVYCFIYPNLMINRYGPWLDLNIVFPLSVDTCVVVIEWFVEKGCLDRREFIEESIKASDKVNLEDIELCENVMNGLRSDGFDVGRYIPSKEIAAFHFHKLLYNDYLR
jgi:choline monooxygenase